MASFLFPLFLSAVLTLPSAQDPATPPTPSLADAARAARERQKTSTPKKVLTDDDVSHSGGSGTSRADEAATRAQLEKDATVPKNPTAADLQHRIYDFSVASGDNVPSMVGNMQRGAIYGHEKVDFPGKKEWEDQMEVAVTHWLSETGPAADRLKAILQENHDALNRGVPGTSQKVRQQWIDALVPYTIWQMRVHQLTLDGQSRSEAAAKTNPR